MGTHLPAPYYICEKISTLIQAFLFSLPYSQPLPLLSLHLLLSFFVSTNPSILLILIPFLLFTFLQLSSCLSIIVDTQTSCSREIHSHGCQSLKLVVAEQPTIMVVGLYNPRPWPWGFNNPHPRLGCGWHYGFQSSMAMSFYNPQPWLRCRSTHRPTTKL